MMLALILTITLVACNINSPASTTTTTTQKKPIDLPSHIHTVSTDTAVAPTCTTTGLTEGKHCSVCNEVLVAQEVVDALGHTEVIDEAVAPTCSANGLTEGKHCSVCNEVIVAQTVVDALGHTEVIDEAKAPTCTANGLTEGKHCSVCNEVLVAQETVNAKGHNEVIDKAVAPTNKESGLTEGKHCSVCGTVLVAQEVIPALGYTSPTITIENIVVSADGSEVTFDVCINKNPGIMNMLLSMTVNDDVFGFKTAVKGDTLPSSTFTKPGSKVTTSPYNFLFDAMEVTDEDKTDGVLFTVTLTVKDSSAIGNYDIIFSYVEGDIVDENFESVDMQIENGIITLE